MVHRNTSRRSKAKATTILRLPDLEQSKSAVLIRSGPPVRKNPTVMPSLRVARDSGRSPNLWARPSPRILGQYSHSA